MTTTTRIDVENPFREDSKLWDIFRFMADGERHSIREIANNVYYPNASSWTPCRRRVASALRTIRAKSGLDVLFDGACYRLVEVPHSIYNQCDL